MLQNTHHCQKFMTSATYLNGHTLSKTLIYEENIMIGDRIKKLRKQKGISLTELADRADISKSYLSNIERNLNQNPSIHFLMKLSKPLDVSIEYLLTGTARKETLNTEKDLLDEEWQTILETAIKEGINKDDFREYINYIKFKIWEKNKADK